MCDEWMPGLQLALTEEEFRQLPRSAAYQYDYLGKAVLTPRPRYYHARLPLPPPARQDPPELGGGVTLRPVTEDDINDLIRCFTEAFRGVEPFATLAEQARAEAARQCLGRTFRGGDGPWFRQASFAAVGGGRIV